MTSKAFCRFCGKMRVIQHLSAEIQHLFMVKEAIPFVAAPILIAVIVAIFFNWLAAIPFILLALFMAYFFRDPRRTVPTEADIVVSAADGKVTRVEERADGNKFVSVFLSPVDVHINRAPIAGRVTKVELLHGKKAPATGNNASETNERNQMTIEGEKMTVVCTQIVGILARRIVCWRAPGDTLEIGEKYGLIKFGSRTDLLMPNQVEVLVKVGDRVTGGETIIGRLKN